jgi:hypothetical protein
MNCVSCLTHIAEYVIINISGQGLSAELGKHIWLAKANISQETPISKSWSSSQSSDFKERLNEEIYHKIGIYEEIHQFTQSKSVR